MLPNRWLGVGKVLVDDLWITRLSSLALSIVCSMSRESHPFDYEYMSDLTLVSCEHCLSLINASECMNFNGLCQR